MKYRYYKYLHFLCSQRMFTELQEIEPIGVMNRTLEDWQADSLEDCIMNDDPQCVIPKGSIVDHQVVGHQSTTSFTQTSLPSSISLMKTVQAPTREKKTCSVWPKTSDG